MPLKLCLDPGHGGYDPGAVANGLRESDLNLAVCLNLAALLDHAGVPVVLTREDDSVPGGVSEVNHDLQARCDICNDSGANLFLSVHINAFDGSGRARGAESYVWPGGLASTIAPQLVDAISPIMGIHGEPVKDGGPNGADLWVINETNPPAILLELGFIDSSDGVKIRDNVATLAARLADVLIKVCGGQVPQDVPKPEPVAIPSNEPTPVSHDDLVALIENLTAEFNQKLDALQAAHAQALKELEEKLKG